jgi:hypothetical protein
VTFEENQEWLIKMTKRLEELTGKKLMNRTEEERTRDLEERWKQYYDERDKRSHLRINHEANVRTADSAEPVQAKTISATNTRCDRE